MIDNNDARSSSATTSGRVAALVLLILAVVYGIAASRIEYDFASDPLGPRVFPIALSVVLALLALTHLMRPGDDAEPWPRGKTALGAFLIPALVAATAILLEPLGFPVVVFMLTAGVGRVFGASWIKAIVGGLGQAILWYVIFGLLLDVYLPMGKLFG